MPAHEYYLPQRRLVSQDDAAIIESPTVPRSRFVGSWNVLTTFNAGYLVPFMVDEILPGDHMTYRVTAMVRMATPLFPIMDSQRIDTFFFFVPNRLVWPNFVRMMGEQTDPDDSIDFVVPHIASPLGGFLPHTIYDHMGLPRDSLAAGQTIEINALPLRMYNMIYNEWFRDQNVMGNATINTGNGPDAHTDYALMRRAKSHDYFTSALPWPQKFTAPTVPVGGLAPVLGIAAGFVDPVNGTPATFTETGGGTATGWAGHWLATTAGAIAVEASGAGVGSSPMIFADLSQATGVAINTFRQAFMIQSLLERDARGGTRYVELIRSHFGVTNPDFRLQRPEYIGGGQTPLHVTPVAQTAPTEDSVVGALGAAGTAAGEHHASYAATEHGFILGIINVRTQLSYQYGVHRMWKPKTRFDYYWPSLAQLGEQAILRGEIWAQGNSDDDIVFGYQERWHEYRTRTSEVHGMFRSGVSGSLDSWHLAQAFSSAPTLSQEFLWDDPPMARVLAAGSLAANQQYLADILITRTAVRPIPTFGTPANLGRF